MNFKGPFRSLACFLLLIPFQGFGRSAFDSLSQDDFAPVNRQGNVVYSSHIANISLGEGLPNLSMSFDFCSGAAKPSPHLGWGWKCTLFEAHAFPARENLYQVQLICAEGSFCGKTIYLLKDSKDPRKYQSMDKEWAGALDGDIFRIERDGVQLEYEKGKLHRMKIRQGNILEWVWKENRLNEIRMDGKKLLEVNYDEGTGLASALTMNGKKYGLGMEVWNPKETSERSLSKVNWPDGSWEAYQLSFGENEGQLKIRRRDGKEQRFSWDKQSGKILSDDQYTYTVGKSDGFYERPPISKTNKEGKTSSFYHDTKKGITTFQAEDGTLTKEYHLLTKGKNNGKLYRVEKIKDEKKDVVFEAEYDSEGRLVKQIENGVTVTFGFDEFGNRYEKSREGKMTGQKAEHLATREKELTNNIDSAKGEVETDEACLSLASFYIHESKEVEKALRLEAKIHNPENRYNLLIETITWNSKLTKNEKRKKCVNLLKEFPDHKDELEELIQEYGALLKEK